MQQQAEQAEANLSLSNTITSLRLLGDIVWRALIARTSLLMHEMQAPHVFQLESDATQDATLACDRASGAPQPQTELVVARALLASIQIAAADRRRTPARRSRIAGILAARPGPRERCVARSASDRRCCTDWKRWRTPRATRFMSDHHGVGHCRADVLRSFATFASPKPALVLARTACSTLLPASEAVIAIVNRSDQRIGAAAAVAAACVDRRHPGRAQCARGHSFHVGQRRRNTQTLARKLEHHYLANAEQHAQFALLTDYLDADTESDARDAALLREAIAVSRRARSTLPARARTCRDGFCYCTGIGAGPNPNSVGSAGNASAEN